MVEFAQADRLSERGPQELPELPRPLSLARAAATLKSLLPLRRTSFERQLAAVVRDAQATRLEFYVPDYAARRALREQLVIDVDPSLLRYRLRHRMGPTNDTRYLQDRFIGAGDWSELLEALSTSSTHKEVADIVAADFDYRRTPAYVSAMRHAIGRDPVRRNFVRLRSAALVESYYRVTAELCRSIEQNGIVRRADCRKVASLFTHPRIRLPWVELTESDIGVAVGAKGELYRFGSGKHRTAAAQAIGLPSMPVEVRMVHVSWLRAKIGKSGGSPVEALVQGLRDLAARSVS